MSDLPPLPPTRVVLIYCGDRQHDDPMRLRLHSCNGLSDLGREQCSLLRRRLETTGELGGTTTLISSNVTAALETADEISSVLGLTAAASCDFCEPHHGECEGMTVDEWSATLGQERLDNWSPFAPKSPGGESIRQAVDRVGRALTEAVLEDKGGTIVIVTHTIPIRAALAEFLGLPYHGINIDPKPTHSGITEFVVEGWRTGTAMKARFLRFNDHAHLAPGAWGHGES